MEDVNWGKIAGRVLAAIFFLSFCRTLSRTVDTSTPSSRAINALATSQAESPLMLTAMNSFRPTRSYSQWNTRAARDNNSAILDNLGTLESLQSDVSVASSILLTSQARLDTRENPTPFPTRTPYHTRTPRPASDNLSDRQTSEPTSSTLADDTTAWNISNYIDIESVKNTTMTLGIYWILLVLPTLFVLWMLNGVARILVDNSSDMVNQRAKRMLTNQVLTLYGIIHLLSIFGFYAGTVLLILAFLTIFVMANSATLPTVIAIVLMVVTSMLIVITLRAMWLIIEAFHRPDGINYYRLMPDEAPELFDLLTKITSQQHAPSISWVWLTPDTEVALYQRGLWIPIPGIKSQRILRLGIAGLQHLTVSQLESLIVHQHLLFQRRGLFAFLGALIIRGRDNMNSMADRFKTLGYDEGFNYLRFTFQGFRQAYITVTEDTVKLQSLMADTDMIQIDSDFHQTLTDLEFVTYVYNVHRKKQVEHALDNQSPILNWYKTMFNREDELELAASQFERNLYYPSVQSDRFPSMQIRLDAMSKEMGELTTDKPVHSRAIYLLADPDGLMHKMTILRLRYLTSSQYRKLR